VEKDAVQPQPEAPGRKPFTTVEAQFLEAGVVMDAEAQNQVAEAGEAGDDPIENRARWRALLTALDHRGAALAIVAGIALLGGAAMWGGADAAPVRTPALAVAAAAPIAPRGARMDLAGESEARPESDVRSDSEASPAPIATVEHATADVSKPRPVHHKVAHKASPRRR
jgi:hypothetical protein